MIYQKIHDSHFAPKSTITLSDADLGAIFYELGLYTHARAIEYAFSNTQDPKIQHQEEQSREKLFEEAAELFKKVPTKTEHYAEAQSELFDILQGGLSQPLVEEVYKHHFGESIEASGKGKGHTFFKEVEQVEEDKINILKKAILNSKLEKLDKEINKLKKDKEKLIKESGEKMIKYKHEDKDKTLFDIEIEKLENEKKRFKWEIEKEKEMLNREIEKEKEKINQRKSNLGEKKL